MGRHSKQYTELTTASLSDYLLKREDTAKKLVVVTRLLDSALKTRSTNGARKKKYISELTHCLKKLCTDSTDMLMYKERWKKVREDYERESRKRCDFQNENIELGYIAKEVSELRKRLEDETKNKHNAERRYGDLSRENALLSQKNEKLQAKLEALKGTKKV